MGVVDADFYTCVYGGKDADLESFPTLCARASDVVGALTHWAVDETTITRLPALHQTLYKKAICAQIDFFAINGTDYINETDTGGFTVGKVSVQGKAAQNGGKLSGSVSAMAIAYLEQTGLMNPQVPTLDRWWW